MKLEDFRMISKKTAIQTKRIGFKTKRKKENWMKVNIP